MLGVWLPVLSDGSQKRLDCRLEGKPLCENLCVVLWNFYKDDRTLTLNVSHEIV